jgi:hypothetical protein
MTLHTTLLDGSQKALLAGYLENLALLERLHRLLLDVIKDEFERLGILEINSVQALLLFNIGENEEIDRRSVRVRLTEKGRRVRGQLVELFGRQAEGLAKKGLVDAGGMEGMNQSLKRMERYWADQIRYIY